MTFHHLDAIYFSYHRWKALHFLKKKQLFTVLALAGMQIAAHPKTGSRKCVRSRDSWQNLLSSVQLIFSKLLHMSLDEYKIYLKILVQKNIYNYSIWLFHLKSFCVKFASNYLPLYGTSKNYNFLNNLVWRWNL